MVLHQYEILNGSHPIGTPGSGTFTWVIEQSSGELQMTNTDFNYKHVDKNDELITTKENTPVGMLAERTSFYHALTKLINSYSIEGESDTPDWILAEYIENCLEAFTIASRSRDHYYGIEIGESFEEDSDDLESVGIKPVDDDCCGQCNPCTKHDH